MLSNQCHRSCMLSDQTWDGNDMNTYADDLAELIAALDLRDAVLVGHSTGGGEVAHYKSSSTSPCRSEPVFDTREIIL